MFITIINEYYYRYAREREKRKSTHVNERVGGKFSLKSSQLLVKLVDRISRERSYLCQRFENCDGKTDAPLYVITGNNFVTIHGWFSCALKAAIRWMQDALSVLSYIAYKMRLGSTSEYHGETW